MGRNLIDSFSDSAQFDFLRKYAEPFQLFITTLSDQCEIKLRHPTLGFAVGTVHNADMYVATDTMSVFFAKIEQMKVEILGRETGNEVPIIKVKEKANPPRMLKCPDHGNEMVPGEPSVLKCPIDGCSREARKKTNGAAFKRACVTVPPPDATVKDAAELAVESAIAASHAALPHMIALTPPVSEEKVWPTLAGKKDQGFNGQGALREYEPNNNTVQFCIGTGGRMFLVQETSGGCVYIDVTTAGPDYQMKRTMNGLGQAGLIECELRLCPSPILGG